MLELTPWWKEAGPIPGRMEQPNDHDRFVRRLIEDQIVAEFGNYEPTHAAESRACVPDSPAQIEMQGEEVRRIKNLVPNPQRCFWILRGDVRRCLVEVALSSRTEARCRHERRN